VGYPKIGGRGLKERRMPHKEAEIKKKREKSREEGNKKIKVKWY